MRIGFISTRLKGTDGVSLEVEKWSRILSRMGHDVFFCAGELGGYASQGDLIPWMHFQHPAILSLNERAFGGQADQAPVQLMDEIHRIAAEIKPALRQFILANHLDLLVVQNALAIPMNLPLGVCLSELIKENHIAAIAHHHDFFWERTRFQVGGMLEFLDAYFPPHLPNIQHVTINSLAQNRLKARRGIASVIVPNVYDFATPPPGVDEYTLDFREKIGMKGDDLLILQPTRVIQRKGIELSLELVNRLRLPNARLIITHSAGDEGLSYWRWIQHEAACMGAPLFLIDAWIAEQRAIVNQHKQYTLWDAYPHADLVTYPSLYEGFGNALLETVYFKRLAVVNRYPVYVADLAPLGFQFVELEDYVSENAVRQVHQLLHSPEQVRQMTEQNYQIAQEHFSLQILQQKIQNLLSNVI
jgi:glycosyltransferase involved in cell wall biosynthesis